MKIPKFHGKLGTGNNILNTSKRRHAHIHNVWGGPVVKK